MSHFPNKRNVNKPLGLVTAKTVESERVREIVGDLFYLGSGPSSSRPRPSARVSFTAGGKQAREHVIRSTPGYPDNL